MQVELLDPDVQERQEIALLAMAEANVILRFLRKPEISSWPKGVNKRNQKIVTPLDIALGYPVWYQGDYWWAEIGNWYSIELAANDSRFAVFEDEYQRALTPELAREKDDEYKLLGLVLPELLSTFLDDWVEGKYPELVLVESEE